MPDNNWMTKELANSQSVEDDAKEEERIRGICGDADDCGGGVSCIGCWMQKVADWSWGRSYSTRDKR